MPNRLIKYFLIWFVLIFVLSFVVENWTRINLFVFGRPDAQDLAFNQPDALYENRPLVVSRDEQINMDVFERVHEAVVNIVATTLTVNFWMQVIPQQGQGSGFIIDDRGYILTNNHVVADAQKITVTFGDGKKATATLIGRDPSNDLAVIKISKSKVGAVVPLGNSDEVRVGQKAIAIGNPFGLSQTLTTGIVSALNRDLKEKSGAVLTGLIQTDAAINPGNSGGPLLNSNGEVVGINTAIFSLSGGYQGIGFAIPVNRAREVAAQLIATGKYAQPWLGISGMALTREFANVLQISSDEGILVVGVYPESPAYNAGLRGGDREMIVGNYRVPVGGDVVLSLNGKKVLEMDDLIREVKRHQVGDVLSLEILRKNRSAIVSVVLGENPS